MCDGNLDWVNGDRGHEGKRIARDVLRQFEVNRPRTLVHRGAESITYQRGDAGGADYLPGHFGQRLHRGDNVDDLEPPMAAAHDRILPGDHHHRHGAQISIRGSGGEVEGARAERGDADARPAGEPAVGGGHEGRGLLEVETEVLPIFSRSATSRTDRPCS